MACLKIDKGVAGKCRDAKPGLTQIVLMNYDDVASFTLNVAENEVSGITMTTGTTAYSFSLNRENASFTDTAEINIPNGTSIYRPSVNFKISSLDTDVRDTFYALSQGDVIVLAKSLGGTWYVLGRENGMSLSTGSNVASGLDAASFQGLDVTLEGLEATPYIEVSSTFDVTTLL